MLKLCVICHAIGKPFDAAGWQDYFIYGVFLAELLKAMHSNLCPQCENRNCMIPIDTPRAQKIIKENELEIKEFVRDNKSLGQMGKYVWEKDYEPSQK